MKHVLDALREIQFKLKVSKNQKNTFGNYSYRSAEDILEAVKRLAYEQDCVVFISDTLELVGDRYYIKASVTITHCESSESKTVDAWARESLDKKGMDSSQITGSTSSYARKYALNGLFAIDDTKDSDFHDNSEPKKYNIKKPVPKTEVKTKKGIVTFEDSTNSTKAIKEVLEVAIGDPPNFDFGDDKDGKCSVCKMSITNKVNEFSKKMHGKPLCFDHQPNKG